MGVTAKLKRRKGIQKVRASLEAQACAAGRVPLPV